MNMFVKWKALWWHFRNCTARAWHDVIDDVARDVAVLMVLMVLMLKHGGVALLKSEADLLLPRWMLVLRCVQYREASGLEWFFRLSRSRRRRTESFWLCSPAQAGLL